MEGDDRKKSRIREQFGLRKKIIEKNEIETVILQRRAIRSKTKLTKGSKLKSSNLISLRPCPKNGILPFEINRVTGKYSKKILKKAMS